MFRMCEVCVAVFSSALIAWEACAGFSPIALTGDPSPLDPNDTLVSFGRPDMEFGPTGGIAFVATAASGQELICMRRGDTAVIGFACTTGSGQEGLRLPGAFGPGFGVINRGVDILPDGRIAFAGRRDQDHLFGVYILDPNVSPPTIDRVWDNSMPIEGLPPGVSLSGVGAFDAAPGAVAFVVEGTLGDFEWGAVCISQQAGPSRAAIQTGDQVIGTGETVQLPRAVLISDDPGGSVIVTTTAAAAGDSANTRFLCGKTTHLVRGGGSSLAPLLGEHDAIPGADRDCGSWNFHVWVEGVRQRVHVGCTSKPNADGRCESYIVTYEQGASPASICVSCSGEAPGGGQPSNFAFLFGGTRDGLCGSGDTLYDVSLNRPSGVLAVLRIGDAMMSQPVSNWNSAHEQRRGGGSSVFEAGFEGGGEGVVLYTREPSTPCDADLDGSGAVDLGDIAIIINNWARVVIPGDAFSGDANRDGRVSLADIARVIAGWGGASCD